MKKLLLFLSVFTLLSCVDRDFDLSKVDDADIVVGDEIIAPIGKVTIKYSDIEELTKSKATTIFTIPETFNISHPLSSGFDQGIIDQIGANGAQSIVISVKHELKDIELKVKLYFDEDIIIHNGDTKDEINIPIDKEMLEKIAKAKKITLEFSTKGEGQREVSVDLDNTAIVVNLSLYRKGGIKF